MKKTARQILDELIGKAVHKGYFIGSAHYYTVQECLRTGRPIPDKCLPGRLLDELTPEEREALKALTSDDTKNERFPGK